MMKRLTILVFFALFLSACAGFERGCSSSVAKGFGADWVVVELRLDGTPYRCWMLEGVSISNEQQSDGIYWKTPLGHLVHVSGSYDYVQVRGGNWDTALEEVNMTEEACDTVNNSVYDPTKQKYVLP